MTSTRLMTLLSSTCLLLSACSPQKIPPSIEKEPIPEQVSGFKNPTLAQKYNFIGTLNSASYFERALPELPQNAENWGIGLYSRHPDGAIQRIGGISGITTPQAGDTIKIFLYSTSEIPGDIGYVTLVLHEQEKKTLILKENDIWGSWSTSNFQYGITQADFSAPLLRTHDKTPTSRIFDQESSELPPSNSIDLLLAFETYTQTSSETKTPANIRAYINGKEVQNLLTSSHFIRSLPSGTDTNSMCLLGYRFHDGSTQNLFSSYAQADTPFLINVSLLHTTSNHGPLFPMSFKINGQNSIQALNSHIQTGWGASGELAPPHILGDTSQITTQRGKPDGSIHDYLIRFSTTGEVDTQSELPPEGQFDLVFTLSPYSEENQSTQKPNATDL